MSCSEANWTADFVEDLEDSMVAAIKKGFISIEEAAEFFAKVYNKTGIEPKTTKEKCIEQFKQRIEGGY
jgi:polyhydroxyalkanoate synthesis regulator phasin